MLKKAYFTLEKAQNTHRLCAQADAAVLGAEKFLDAYNPALFAEPRLLGAAKLRNRIGNEPSIDAYQPGFEIRSNSQDPIEVTRINIEGKAQIRAIGALDDIALIGETLKWRNRSESSPVTS